MAFFNSNLEKSKPVVIDANSPLISEQKPKFFKQILAFCLSLVGAAVLWFLSALNHNYTSDIRYPIRIVYDASKYIPLAKLPTSVVINATGYGWAFLRKTMSIKNKPILLKPNTLPFKKYYTDDELMVPFAHQLTTVKVNFFETDTIFFKFDRVASKRINLVVDTSECIVNFKEMPYLNFKTSPEVITVTGPQSMLGQLPDSIHVKLFQKELMVGYSELFELKDLDNPLFKRDASEVEVSVEKKNHP